MIKTVIGGITIVVLTYIALAYAQGAASVAKGFTGSYGNVAKAFRGE